MSQALDQSQTTHLLIIPAMWTLDGWQCIHRTGCERDLIVCSVNQILRQVYRGLVLFNILWVDLVGANLKSLKKHDVLMDQLLWVGMTPTI